jgi:hypothetical protein
LIDILESNKEKKTVPFDELDVDSLDFDAMKRDLQEDGKWPTDS